jgi:hypothetical protein
VREELNVRVLECRADAEDLGIRLRVDEAREPSHVAHRAHALCGMSSSVRMTPQGAWNGWWPAAARSSESCWIRGSWLPAVNGYGALAGGSVGSSAARAVHAVQLLGERVVRLHVVVARLHVVVADRPRGRDAVVVAQLAGKGRSFASYHVTSDT